MAGRECLCCGQLRMAGTLSADECPRCGYVGWAPLHALTEDERRRLRDHPLVYRAAAANVLRPSVGLHAV
jgi:hypothetical protein